MGNTLFLGLFFRFVLFLSAVAYNELDFFQIRCENTFLKYTEIALPLFQESR